MTEKKKTAPAGNFRAMLWALGAAVCAFVARGDFASYEEAVAAMVHIRDTFYPDAEQSAYYQRLYKDVYKHYYKTVRPLHRALSRLNQPN